MKQTKLRIGIMLIWLLILTLDIVQYHDSRSAILALGVGVIIMLSLK